MATPLGTTSFTDEEVVAQSDIKLIGTTVETLTVEFDQAKFETLISSGSLSPKAMRKIHESTNQRELRVCEPKRDPELRVPFIERKPCVYVPEHELRESQAERSPQRRVSKVKRGSQPRVLLIKREPRVQQGVAIDPRAPIIKRGSQPCVRPFRREPRVSSLKRGGQLCIQNFRRGLRVPNLKRGSHPCVPAFRREPRVPDLKRGSQPRVQTFKRDPRVPITESSACRCCSHAAKLLVSDRLTNVTWSTKRRHSHKKKTSEVEYLGVTSNTIGIGRPSVSSSDESEKNRSPRLKEVSNDADGVYLHTRTRTAVISPVNYRKLARGIESDDEHSAIAESQSSSSFVEHETSINMTGSHDDLRRRLEEFMRSQQEAMRSQQESINQLREMMAQIIADGAQFPMSRPTLQPESSRRRGRYSRRKGKVNEASDQEAHHIESSSEEEKKTENKKNPQSTKMEELEARLSAIANRSEPQDEGHVRPYPAEWDSAPYPPKFEAPTLQAFDGKGSPNQHIYHFKSQTGNVISNDAILARLFIGTLKGVAFEWFMKLPAGCIQKWTDLERLFLSRFFEDDTEVSVHTLLATKQEEGESIQAFVKRFRGVALQCPTGMTQYALVATCRHNLQTKLLARMGVADCRSWRQLISQGEQAEKIVARIEAEEESEEWDQAQSSQPEGEDTTDTEDNPLQ